MIGILQGIGAASRFSLAEIGRVPRRHRFALAVLRVVVSGVAPQGLSEDGGRAQRVRLLDARPLVGWEGARAADRRRRRSAGRAGEAARPRPWESRAGATGLGSDGGEADGRGGGARGATRLGRDGASNCASCFQAPTEYPARAGRGPGHAVGLRPPPRPLPALPDRSRRGTGPISSRNPTDLGTEPDRSRHGTRPISARNRTDLDAAGSQPLRETTRSAQGPA